MNEKGENIVQHDRHIWQYIQREMQPPVNTEAWFICECGALKLVHTFNEKSETYQMKGDSE